MRERAAAATAVPRRRRVISGDPGRSGSLHCFNACAVWATGRVRTALLQPLPINIADATGMLLFAVVFGPLEGNAT
jgi:hypothetical protein